MLLCVLCAVLAQSWLVARKAQQARPYFQFGYALSLLNTAQEPLQVVRKAWTVQDMTGALACILVHKIITSSGLPAHQQPQ